MDCNKPMVCGNVFKSALSNDAEQCSGLGKYLFMWLCKQHLLMWCERKEAACAHRYLNKWHGRKVTVGRDTPWRPGRLNGGVKWHIETGLLLLLGEAMNWAAGNGVGMIAHRAGYMGFFGNWGHFGIGAEQVRTSCQSLFVSRKKRAGCKDRN